MGVGAFHGSGKSYITTSFLSQNSQYLSLKMVTPVVLGLVSWSGMVPFMG